jgi:sigma-B regulation protein RsbU (phosphoserine phosphatase)
MYTDGVTEAVNIQNDMFGRERLAAIIKRLHQSPPKEVVRGIREGLDNFSGGKSLADDTTVVVCRIT